MKRSLSARRAWIEMSISFCSSVTVIVALRKESVDRNENQQEYNDFMARSLSARRAWIEICLFPSVPGCISVALRKESVDRNFRVPAW